jgi:hypothetical protein
MKTFLITITQSPDSTRSRNFSLPIPRNSQRVVPSGFWRPASDFGLRISFVFRLLALSLFLPVLAQTAGQAAPSSRPNILFIAVDDLRPELNCYGNPIIKSPNIDRLAQAGVVFNRAYCQQAVCSPSRSSLLTGTRPDTTKVWDLKTHFRKALPDVVTLPQLFKNNGYFVQGMGKIYHGGYNDPPSWSVPWTTPKAQAYASAENKALVRKKRQEAIADGRNEEEVQQAGKGPAYEGADVPDNTFHDGALADMAITALRDIKQKKQPFFLAVGFIRPHLPFVSPKKYWDLYDPAKIPLAPNPFRPKGARHTPSWKAASCAAMKTSLMGIWRMISPAGSSMATMRRSATGTPRWGACWTNWTGSACATTPSSFSGATTAGSWASMTPGANTATSRTTPGPHSFSPCQA